MSFIKHRLKDWSRPGDNGEAIDSDQVCCVNKYNLYLMHFVKLTCWLKENILYV